MKRKILWLLVSSLMVLSLVIASCGPVAVEEEEEVVVEKEEPQYGGVVTIVVRTDIAAFDEAFSSNIGTYHLKFTSNELLGGDWCKGAAGTGEADWGIWSNNRFETKTGLLAESWESPEVGHLSFKIRQGMHYGLNPDSEASRLVNGRELTADDIVYSLNRLLGSDRSYLNYTTPQGLKDTIKITAPDKWTVDIQCPPEYFIYVLQLFTDFATADTPREVIEKYGDMLDWHNVVGTGPFFLTDYVSGSQMTFIRNPNYWEKDGCGPGKGNQLPYVDGVKMLIITDASTRLAALRAGRLDQFGAYGGMAALTRDDILSLMETTPELKYKTIPREKAPAIYMRTDNPDLAFSDKRVRRALMMAIDYNTINDTLYGGEAKIQAWPLAPVLGYEAAHLSLDAPDCPESVKELYVYNPEKAKQLLTEAGYPDGFKTEVMTASDPQSVDYLSIIKDMWEKIGVELELDVKEASALRGIYNAMNHKEMYFMTVASSGTYIRMVNFSPPALQNKSMIDDPLVEEAKVKMFAAYNEFDEATVDELHRELMKYVLDQAWVIPQPAAPKYTVWWPWLKNYHGEDTPGYTNTNLWVRYVWLDQGLKKSMGY